MPRHTAPHPLYGLLLTALALATACASGDSLGYRLGQTGEHWVKGGGDAVLVGLRERYPAYFDVLLVPTNTREPDLRPLRDDLERAPVDRHNFDALNALAIGYFEMNYRADSEPGGPSYFADSFRAAKLIAVPWRAYGEIENGALRTAILDFFADAASGTKLGTRRTAPRLAAIIASFEAKETDRVRLERIRALSAGAASH